MSDSHPFLEPEFLPAWRRLTPVYIVPDMTEAIRRAEIAVGAIIEQPHDSLTYASTFEAFDNAVLTVTGPWSKVSHLENTMNTADFREPYQTAQAAVTRFLSGLTFRSDLWEVLRTFGESKAVAALKPIYQRHVSEVMADFRESGADLAQAKKDRLVEIEEKLSRVTSDFQNNALDSLNAYERIVRDEAELAGLPPSAIEAAKEDAQKREVESEEAPAWRFTLHAPSFIPVMRFANSENLRRELWEAYRQIASAPPRDNEPLIQEILALRQEKAELLGKSNFADVVLARRMARSGAAALAFVRDLEQKTQPAFRREIEELIDFKARSTGEARGLLKPWEIAYWSEKMRREASGLDPESLRPYFSMEGVLRGLFELCEELFGIQVKERRASDRPELWHDEVGFYDVIDRDSKKPLGSFYTDWHPRDSKRSGAWLDPISTGRLNKDGSLEPHLGVMCGNLSRPVGGKPALLSHDEVETIFHEFGHCLHHLLSEVPVAGLGGTNVAWDFVELPSQIMENWCWDRAGLDRFAMHYQSGETLPDELFEQLRKTRAFQAGMAQMRQVSFALTDLSLHLEYATQDPKPDLEQWWRTLNADLIVPATIEPRSNLRNFSHLFAGSIGYAAGYYSYKWAEVLEADAFSRFQNEGITNPKTGADFRKHILSRGNGEEPEQLFRAFMGRDPDPDALLRRLGLIDAAESSNR